LLRVKQTKLVQALCFNVNALPLLIFSLIARPRAKANELGFTSLTCRTNRAASLPLSSTLPNVWVLIALGAS